MEAGAAGDDVHGARALQNFRGRRTEGRFEQPSVGDPLLQRVGDGARLLVDLLQHEVPVRTLLGRIRRDFALAYLALARLSPLRSMIRTARAAHLGDVALFEEHETAGHRQQRRDVGGDEILVQSPSPTTTGQPSRARISRSGSCSLTTSSA